MVIKRLIVASNLILLSAFMEVSAQTFSATNYINLPDQIDFANSAWGDYDNDGHLDFITTGALFGTTITRVYKNTPNGYEAQNFPELPNAHNGFVRWGDYNNDGKLDVLIAGQTVFSNSTSGITKIYKNTGTGFQEQFIGLLPPLTNGDGEWFDYNNDGLLDFIVAGVSITSNGNGGLNQAFISKLYKNTGSSFVEVFTGTFQGLGYSSLDVADYNADGLLDIVISGSLSSGTSPLGRTKIYKNNRNGFSEVFTDQIPGAGFGDVKWWDFDNNGLMDIVISGADGSRITKIFKNNEAGFIEAFAGILPAVNSSSIDVGDFDSDGDADLVLSGDNGTEPIVKIFRNDKTNLVEVFAEAVDGVYLGGVHWGDSDGDGDLDILVRGLGKNNERIEKIYLNGGNSNAYAANSKPTPPTLLTQNFSNGITTFTWNTGSDTETTAAGLTYNLYVRNLADTIISPQSLAKGKRKIVKMGRTYSKTIDLKSLPRGIYNWSVQAIDNNFEGSEFAPESFIKVNVIPIITATKELKVGFSKSFAISLGDLIVSDSDGQYPTGYTLTVKDGANYTRNGSQITPIKDFTGNLSIPVSVNDGMDDSPTFNATLRVNVKPVITKVKDLTITDVRTLTISLNDLTVADADGQYPTGYSITVKDGSNYTRNGNTIAVTNEFAGDLSVPITINDGLDESDIFNAKVTVQLVTGFEESIFDYQLVSVSPNPFANKIIVTVDSESADLAISLQTLTGQPLDIHPQRVSTKSYEIDNVASQPPGLYIVIISNGNSFVTKKLLKFE